MRNIAILLLSILFMTASVAPVTAASRLKSSAAKWVNTRSAYTILNDYRDKRHVGALKRNPKLEKVARIRAAEMAESGNISHVRPNGKSSLTLITKKRVGHRVRAKGENIAMGYSTCSHVSTAWYNSRGHRENMLRKSFRYVGIAGCRYRGTTYWVQVFSG